MEAVALLAAVVALVALGALALRFGHDSRDGVRGQERAVIAAGMVYPGRTHEQELASEIQEARQRRLARNRAEVTRFLPSDGDLARAA